jgi:hypothetical protein
MEDILKIINTISTTDFMAKYQFLTDNANRNKPEYLAQLEEWNLFSEKLLIENNGLIQKRLANNNIKRKFNKTAFDSKGDYDWDRYYTLKMLIK